MALIHVPPATNNASTNLQNIQGAINKITGPAQWDEVRFPPQTYVINGRLNITKSRYWINGNWATIRMQDQVNGEIPMTLIDLGSTDFHWYDLVFDANRQRRPNIWEGSHHTIWIRGARNARFVNIWSGNAAVDGFYIGPLNNTNTSTFPQNITVAGGGAWGAFRSGMSIINGYNIQVHDGYYGYNGQQGVLPRSGIVVEANQNSARPSHRDVAIYRNYFPENEGHGVLVAHPTRGQHINTKVFQNFFYNNLNGGLRTVWPTTIWRNVFEGQTRAGQFLRGQIETNENGPSWIGECTFRNIRQGEAAIRSFGAHGVYIENCCFQNISVEWVRGSVLSWVNSNNTTCPGDSARLGW